MANTEAERRAEVRLLQLCVFLFSITTTVAFYLVEHYYMDPGISRGMGGVCNKRLEDACFYVNSHIDFFGLLNYDSNVDCIMTLDAGSMSGAKFKVEWKRFLLEYGDCSNDFLEVYDGDMTDMTNNTLIGKFCGCAIDISGYPTTRYLTLKFHTDGSVQKDGFRVKAVRYEPGVTYCITSHTTMLKLPALYSVLLKLLCNFWGLFSLLFCLFQNDN